MSALLEALPFSGVLLSFAVFPSMLPRLWHRQNAIIIGAWILLGMAIQVLTYGVGAAAGAFSEVIVAQFLPFIVLILALYALGGGIAITGGPWGTPAGNLCLLLIGTVLASIMGTIGASLLLIHPLLAANASRPEQRHLVLSFIILVGNCGGALSPLGDPPLLIGFLRGVPFFWPFAHLALSLLMVAIPVLAICFFIDMYLFRREKLPTRHPFKVRGTLNIALLVLLALILPLQGVWHPGQVKFFSISLPGEQFATTLFEVVCILLSELFTPKAIRTQNRFAWSAMREILILFLAIFVTIPPMFDLLKQVHLSPNPIVWFWASGVASAILDAAPTYLLFFQAAGGHTAALITGQAPLLTAIAAGSVYFGPLTYLGNAPNLMIREIAVRRGVRMPGFLQYAGIMTLVMIPVYLLVGAALF